MAVAPLPFLPEPLQRIALQRGVALLDRLLDDAARARLAPHAGKRCALRMGGFEIELQIDATGAFAPVDAAGAGAPALRIDADLAELLAARLRGQAVGGVSIAGDAEFAQAVSWSLDHLRLDVEDEIAPWVGDIAAHRIGRAAQQARARVAALGPRAAGAARDWLAQAPRLLVTRAEFDATAADVARLRDTVARLDKRIALLQGRAQG